MAPNLTVASVDYIEISISFFRDADFSLNSCTEQYSTGTTSIVRISIVIPPKDGIAIGTMTSDPRPVDVRMGRRARMVVAVVMRHARIRRFPAMTVASRMCSMVSCSFFLNDCWRYVAITTPSSDAIPKSARKPTHTATLKFIGCIWKRFCMLTPKRSKSRNHGWAYSHNMMNPPDHATRIPLKTNDVVMADLKWKYSMRKITNRARGNTTANVFCERIWFS